MNLTDLHVHSNCSDGTLTPSELVSYASQKGLSSFALTDHDTVKGILEAQKAANALHIELIPGIEFSTEYQGRDVHIVGLDIHPDSVKFTSELTKFQDARLLRNQKMIDLMAAAGFDISWEQMVEAFGEAVWTRAHFARYFLDHHYVSDMKEAFAKYLGDDAPFFIPREKVTPVQAVSLIRETGGIPVLAHPMQYKLPESELNQLILSLKSAGLIGIEAIYSTHRQVDESLIRKLARNNGLCISGGSDFHGSNKPDIDLGCGMGNLKIPYELIEKMRRYKEN